MAHTDQSAFNPNIGTFTAKFNSKFATLAKTSGARDKRQVKNDQWTKVLQLWRPRHKPAWAN